MSQNTKPKRQRQRRKNLQDLQSRTVKAIGADLKPMNQQQIISAFKSSSNQNHQLVLEKLASLESKLGGLTNGAVARIAFKKAGVTNLRELKKKFAEDNIDISEIKDHVLLELVALDDWASIARAAWPYIQKYGAPILMKLYDHYVKPRIDKWMGGDEGINPADWGGVLGPRRFTPVFGENTHMSGIHSVGGNEAEFNTVDTRSIKSCLCPELFKYRYAYTQLLKTAVANVTAEYSIAANASGNVGAVVFPMATAVNGGTYTSTFVSIYNDTTFNPSTGIQTPSASFNAGPLNGSSASIEALRVTNFAVQIIPTASFNTAGSFTLAYKNRSSGGATTATNIGTTLAQSKVWPYVTSFNNKTIVRMITVAGDPSDDGFANPTAGVMDHCFTLIGTGLPASIEACKIVVSAVVEFIPTMAAFPICAMDYPCPGPLTEQFESMMFARFPVLQQMDLVDAKRVSDSLPDKATRYDELLQIMSSAVSGIQPRQYVPHTIAENIGMEASLPELIME